jgi:hypothetical protein
MLIEYSLRLDRGSSYCERYLGCKIMSASGVPVISDDLARIVYGAVAIVLGESLKRKGHV